MLFRRCFLLVVALVIASGQTGAQSVQDDGTIRHIDAGDTVEGHLSGGRPAKFAITLAAASFATVVVSHRLDIVVRAIDAGGGDPLEMSSDGPEGELRLPIHVTRAGSIRFELAAAYPKSPPGSFEFRIEHLRAATPADRHIAETVRLRSQAVEFRRKDAFGNALSAAKEALSLAEKLVGTEPVLAARSLLLVAQLEDIRANYSAAETLYVRARTLENGSSSRQLLLEAQILDSHAASLIARGKYSEAKPLAENALAIREHVAGPSHFLVAASLGTLADLHHESANVQEAAATAERALEVASKWYGPNDIVFGDFSNRVARSQIALGNFARAEQLYRESLAAREKAVGPGSLAAAESLGGLARVSLLSNDNGPSEERHLGSLAIRERLLGPDHPQVANDVMNLALISYRRRDYATALKGYARALAIRETSLGRSHPTIALTLSNIGLVHWRQGDYVRAEDFFTRALELSEQLYGPESLRVTTPLANLGIIAKETGNYALGEARYLRALAIREKHLGPDHPELITLVESLGILYRDRGDYRQAVPMFERVIGLTAASHGPEHPFMGRHLTNLAQLYWAAGDIDKALSTRTRFEAIRERNLPLQLAVGSERQKLAYFEPALADMEETIGFHVSQAGRNAGARDLALTVLLQRKGRIFDALADNISAFRTRATPEDRALLEELSRVTSTLSALVLDPSTRSALGERQRKIATLTEERERLEIEMHKRSAGYLTPSRPLTLAEVQGAVPVDAALIEFCVYRPVDPKASLESEQRLGKPRYVAYVVRRFGETEWRDLGEAQAIERAVDGFRTALADPARSDIGERATALHRLLIDPLQPLLVDVPHLLISPDGPLNLIPFEALRNRRGRYLVEDHLVTYVTTGRDLLRMQTPRPSSGAPVVFADPDFGESSDRFPRLAGTIGEGTRVVGLLPGATLRSGANATESTLKSLHAPRILHIATHGFFLEDPKAATENPLLRSGLAFAGANRARTNSEDGILTALEATNLDLWGTKLVTLSACDTAIGVVRNGEGVFGLRRAFFLAGAESLVMSLWPVSDLVTRDLMAGYYSGLNQGLGRGVALRRLKLQMLRRAGRSHPYYWASFIHAGEWGSLEGKR